MPIKKIKVNDGGVVRTVAVDEGRYQSFDQLRQNQAFASAVAPGGLITGRDSQEAMAFLVSQLAHTEGQVFERLYQPMQYEQLIPLDFSAGEWADTILYEISDMAGQGKRTSGKGRDINKVDVGFAQKSFQVLYGNIGYDYTQEELRRSAHLRRALPEVKLLAAMEGYKRHMNQVGLYGEADSDLTGLFNNPYIPQGSAPVGSWASATPDNVMKDVNTLIDRIWSNTAYNDMPTTIVMAPSALSLLASTPRTNSDKSLLSWVKENNIAKQQRGIEVEFQPGFGLNNAGANGTRRMMAYVKRRERLTMHIPLPLRFLAPQMQGLAIEVPGEYKYSGVEFRYPKSAFYMDGI